MHDEIKGGLSTRGNHAHPSWTRETAPGATRLAPRTRCGRRTPECRSASQTAHSRTPQISAGSSTATLRTCGRVLGVHRSGGQATVRETCSEQLDDLHGRRLDGGAAAAIPDRCALPSEWRERFDRAGRGAFINSACRSHPNGASGASRSDDGARSPRRPCIMATQSCSITRETAERPAPSHHGAHGASRQRHHPALSRRRPLEQAHGDRVLRVLDFDGVPTI